MVIKSTLYLETSIFGFYFDEEPRNFYHRKAVVTLFEQIKRGIFTATTSPITVRELKKAPEPYNLKFLELLVAVKELKLAEDEVERLATFYIDEEIIPEDYMDDARHVAYATISKADVLVSLNLEHLANEWSERKINSVNLREGYSLISIRTPEEVIKYEN